MDSPRRGSRASGPASAPPRTASQFFPETPGFAFDLARQGNNMDEEEEVRMNVHANLIVLCDTTTLFQANNI